MQPSDAVSYDEGMKLIGEIMRQYAREFAAAGGRARARKLSPRRRSEIARKAVEARWARENAIQDLADKANGRKA